MDEAALKERCRRTRRRGRRGPDRDGAHPRPGRRTRGAAAAAFPGCDAIVYGHTHVPEVSRDGGVWILNPGCPTERRRGADRAMLVLEVRRELAPELIELLI